MGEQTSRMVRETNTDGKRFAGEAGEKQSLQSTAKQLRSSSASSHTIGRRQTCGRPSRDTICKWTFTSPRKTPLQTRDLGLLDSFGLKEGIILIRPPPGTRKQRPQPTIPSLKTPMNLRQRSYAETVRGCHNARDWPTQPPHPPPPPPFPIQQSEEEKKTGPIFITAFKEVEGNSCTELRYVGGLNTLLEFDSEVEMNEFLVNGEHIWRPWFKSLIQWSPSLQLNKRIGSIMIYGIPMHALCEEAFTVIASKWGRVLIPDTCDTDNLNLAFGRVGILTDNP
ncbi:hypothetical protein L1887_31871 [Cichorium endivia]|nr:hypothetical protein L1887_31871 [Cichorium endivia]